MPGTQSPDGGDSRPTAQQGGGEDSALRHRVPEYLTIATVLAPWGVRGELKVRLETDFPERFSGLSRVILGEQHAIHELEGFRLHKSMGLLKLRGCDDRDKAEVFRGLEVQVPIAEAVPLPTGEYYEYQIQGLRVRTEDGEALGVVQEVLHTGSNAVLVTEGSRGEVLIPMLPHVVLEVDLEAGRMIVRLPPGLLD